MSGSGIVTGMGTPGTYRVSDGGPLPGDLDMHAAEERLRCYQSFGADLPPGGGEACADTADRRAPGLAGPPVKSRRSKQAVPVVQLGCRTSGVQNWPISNLDDHEADRPCDRPESAAGLAAKRTGIRSFFVMAIRRGFVIITCHCPYRAYVVCPGGARAGYGWLSMIWMSSSRR